MMDFTAAKMSGAQDQKFQTQYNYLLDLLSTYMSRGLLESMNGKTRIDLMNGRMRLYQNENNYFEYDGNTLSLRGTLVADDIVSGRITSTDGSAFFDLDNQKIYLESEIAGKGIRVEMSVDNPFKLSIEGPNSFQDYVYITGEDGYSGPGILVTSKYDVNEDGVVDFKDYMLVLDYFLGRDIEPGKPWPEGYPSFHRMDVDNNGTINSADMDAIFRRSIQRDRIFSTSETYQAGIDSTGFWISDDNGATKDYKFTF